MAVLVCVLALAASALAQEQRGSLEGTVKDAQGAVLPGATVEARSAALIGVRTETTDANGHYRFPALPPGTYQVTASLGGFQTTKSEIVQLSVGQVLRLDVALPLAGVTESVQVTAESTVLDVASARTATTLTAKVIEELPRGRTFNTLLQLAPGVRAETKGGTAGVGGYQFDGTTGSENVFVIDGVDVSNIRNASLGVQDAIPFEFVQELQIKSGGFEAEFGGALGGVVNVISKSGTDQFRGEALYQFSGDALNDTPRANSPVAGNLTTTSWVPQSFRRDPFNVSQSEFFKPTEDSYTNQTYGFTLGGPIARDKLRFFIGYLPERYNTDRDINTVSRDGVVTPKSSSSTVTRNRATGRLDYSPFQKLQVNASYFWNPMRTDGLLISNDPKVAPPTSDLSRQGGYVPSNATTLGANYLPSSKLLLSARYGYKYLNDKGNTYGKDDVPYLVYNTASTNNGLTGVPSQFAGAAGYTNVASTFVTVKDKLTRQNVYLDATYFATIFGQNHTIKGGYALNYMGDDVLSNYTQGRFNINWGEGYTRGSIVNAQGPYGHYTWQDGVRLNSKVNSRNQGLYVQDAWQVTSRLTMNLGLRVENEYLPPFRAEQQVGNSVVKIANPIEFGWGDKLAPRIGGAWDVLGNGRWKIASSWVRVNDVLKYELARGSFGGDYWHDHVYTLNDPDLSKLSLDNPGALGDLLIDIDNRTVPINDQGQIDGIDRNIRPMSHNNFDVTTEFLLNPKATLTARYTHKHLRYGIEDIGLLDAEENEQYVIGNPGYGDASDSGAYGGLTVLGEHLTPKAKRDYDGLELRLTGRMQHLYYNGSYTYSKLYGNWAGLANSDEAGRSDPNVSRAFDLSPGNFDQFGRNVYGRLGTDRPHTLKLFGSYAIESKLGTTMLGLSQVAYSGTPLSSEVTFIVPIFYNGRGDLGRTDTLTQTDLLFSHAVRFGGARKGVFEVNVLNLFNQDAVTNVTTRYNRNGSIPQSYTAALYAGTLGDPTLLVSPAASGPTPNYNPIYNQPLAYQESRRVTLSFRFQF